MQQNSRHTTIMQQKRSQKGNVYGKGCREDPRGVLSHKSGRWGTCNPCFLQTPSSVSSRRSLDGSPSIPTVSPTLRPLDSAPLTPPPMSDGDPFRQLITQSSRPSTEGTDAPGPLPVALPSGGRASWAEGKSQVRSDILTGYPLLPTDHALC